MRRGIYSILLFLFVPHDPQTKRERDMSWEGQILQQRAARKLQLTVLYGPEWRGARKESRMRKSTPRATLWSGDMPFLYGAT
jgi:hypothetical protein